MRPPSPVVKVGLPEMMMLPPVVVPAAVLEPALKIMASVPVPVTAMLLPNVRLPEVVLKFTLVNGVVPPITPLTVKASLATVVNA